MFDAQIPVNRFHGFSFKNATKIELAKRKKDKEEQVEVLKNAIEAARECFRDPKFTKYVAEYQNAEKVLIEQLIALNTADRDTYNASCRNILSKLSVLKLLLIGIEEDCQFNE